MTKIQAARLKAIKAQEAYTAWLKTDEDKREDTQDAILAAISEAGTELDQAFADESAAQETALPLAHECRLSHLVEAAYADKPLSGAEAELFKELKLDEHGPEGGIHLPWAMLLGDIEAADSATTAPAKSNVAQVSIVGRVFAQSVAARLGINFQNAGLGSQSYLVLSAGVSPEQKADVEVKDSEAATLALTVLEPVRLTAAYTLRSIDLRRVPDWEQALRADLTMAMRDKMDALALTGDGNAPNPSGLVTSLAAAADPSGESEFANYVSSLAGGVDGKLAATMAQIFMALPVDAYTHAAGELASGTAVSAAEWLQAKSAGLVATTHLPNAGADFFSTGIQYRTGDGNKSAVAPIWQPELIVDPYSGAAEATRRLTLIWHWNMKLLRTDAHRLVKFQVGTA